jgi:hypothetical protein
MRSEETDSFPNTARGDSQPTERGQQKREACSMTGTGLVNDRESEERLNNSRESERGLVNDRDSERGLVNDRESEIGLVNDRESEERLGQ